MKWILAAVLLAGCTLPGAQEENDEVFGVCPQWIPGEASQHDLQAPGTLLINATNETQGYPLDMFLLRLEGDGVRVLARLESGQRTEFHLVDGQGTATAPHLNLAGSREARVFLSPVEHGTPPAPGSLQLEFDGEGQVQVEAQPFYRVCGQLL